MDNMCTVNYSIYVCIYCMCMYIYICMPGLDSFTNNTALQIDSIACRKRVLRFFGGGRVFILVWSY